MRKLGFLRSLGFSGVIWPFGAIQQSSRWVFTKWPARDESGPAPSPQWAPSSETTDINKYFTWEGCARGSTLLFSERCCNHVSSNKDRTASGCARKKKNHRKTEEAFLCGLSALGCMHVHGRVDIPVDETPVCPPPPVRQPGTPRVVSSEPVALAAASLFPGVPSAPLPFVT